MFNILQVWAWYWKLNGTNGVIYVWNAGTKNERSTFEKALKQCESQFSRYYLNNFSFTDVKFELLMDESVIIGSPFTWVLNFCKRNFLWIMHGKKMEEHSKDHQK